ncbi:MAG: hypothetical protein KDC33_08975 [Thermoleophilia bacterium]|nr:hypothetical protein [Thermoleophilia bacterium]
MTTSPPPSRRFWTDGPGGVLWRSGATAIVALVAAEIAVLLVIFGYGILALAAAALSLAAGLTVWRRGLLPCAVVACAISLPAASATRDPVRIAPRATGVQIVQPRTAAEIRPSYRQGFGALVVDLRRTRLPSGGHLSISARSDTDRVIVALPRDRCVNVRVRRTLLPAPGDVERRALRLAGLPADPRMPAYMVSGFGGPGPAPPAPAFPATSVFSRISGASPDGHAVVRRSRDARAASLDLVVASPANVVVRDFPSSVGLLNEEAWQQVSGSQWPVGVETTPNPGQRREAWAWKPRWSAADRRRGIPRRWARWGAAVVPELRAQAARAAGYCASRGVLAGYWATAEITGRSATVYLSVNGVGRVAWTRVLSDGSVAPTAPAIPVGGAV